MAVNYMTGALGRHALLPGPLNPLGSEAMGLRSKKSAGALCRSLERFPFKGMGLKLCLSFQTPIRESGFIDRSEDLTYSSA